MLLIDAEGKVKAGDKAKGRKKALIALVDKMLEEGIDLDGQKIFICHAACLADAEFVEKKIREKVPGRWRYPQMVCGTCDRCAHAGTRHCWCFLPREITRLRPIDHIIMIIPAPLLISGAFLSAPAAALFSQPHIRLTITRSISLIQTHQLSVFISQCQPFYSLPSQFPKCYTHSEFPVISWI